MVSTDRGSPTRRHGLNLLWSWSADRLPLESRFPPQHKVVACIVGPREKALAAVHIGVRRDRPGTVAPRGLLDARACGGEIPAHFTSLVGCHRSCVSWKRALARRILPDSTRQGAMPYRDSPLRGKRALATAPMWTQKSAKCWIFHRSPLRRHGRVASKAVFAKSALTAPGGDTILTRLS